MKYKFLLLLLLVLTLLFTAGGEEASRYGEDNTSFIYVSVDGDDMTGSGTKDAPFASVHRAAEAARAGDTIRVGAGTYVFTGSAFIPAGVSLEGAGTETIFTSETMTNTGIGGAAALIRLDSEESKEYGNQHISYITFDGRDTAAWAIDIANRHNVSVHDCTVMNFREAGVGWHATDLSAQSIEDANPDVTYVEGSFVTGGCFYNNFLVDNTRFDGGWGRGSLFICGLEDFEVYDNVLIEDVRTSPDGTRGVPLKAWYYAGWLRDIRIHDNIIERLGSAMYSSDGSGWDFAIEFAPPYTGLEVYQNVFIGAVDLNGGMLTVGDRTCGYAAWIHDNTFVSDPGPKYEGGTAFYGEEYAIVLERISQRTLIENNFISGYDTVLYFNGRQEITDVTVRNNICSELGGHGGSMLRLDGRTSNGFENFITVKNLTITGNLFLNAEGRGGFGIILGQEMACPWSLENITVTDNVVDGCVYPYWFAIVKDPASVTNLTLRNNIIHGESGISLPENVLSGYVNEDNRVLTDDEWAAYRAASPID